jgi:glycerophosphoryl diester phosphodiesterase
MIVYGHRGARGEAPENTIAGCRHAVDRGTRHFEIDLRLSKDKQLVVVHDERLKRTAATAGKVGDYTARELARLHASASGPPWSGRRHTGIPTLDALVRALPEVKGWQLELKAGRPASNRALVDAVHEWLADGHRGMVVTSFEPAMLLWLKEKMPDVSTGLISEHPDPDLALQHCECDHLVAHWSTLVNPYRVQQLQSRGIHVSTWTVNDASVIRSLFSQGVDSLISDFPSMALPLVATLERGG